MALEDRLRAAGIAEEDIAVIVAEDDDDEGPRKPRSLSEFKRAWRESEREKGELAAKLAQHDLREAFETARDALPDDMKAMVSFDDVKSEPKITPALLKVAAAEKQERAVAEKQKFASSLGFESVDQFDAFTADFKQRFGDQAQQQQNDRQDMAAATSLTLQGQAPTTQQAGRQTVEQLVEQGASVDDVMKEMAKNRGAFVRRIGEDGRPT